MSANAHFDAATVSRQLVRRARRGALATKDRETGAPYASLVAVASAADGAPILLLSSLARHTANIGDEGRVALLVEQVGEDDPMAGPRVTLSGTIAPTDDPEARRRFLARQPGASGYADFGDFSFWRLEPESAHLVAGFGRIQTIGREKVMTDIADATALVASEAGAVDHMNEDHLDAIALYAERLLGAGPGKWRIEGFDPEGCEIGDGRRVIYLPFPERVTSPGALRQILVRLAEEARAAA